jgi:hypothetical protein
VFVYPKCPPEALRGCPDPGAGIALDGRAGVDEDVKTAQALEICAVRYKALKKCSTEDPK